MDFDLSEEQLLLKDSVDRLVADSYGDFEKRRVYQAEPNGWSAANWQRFAELGLTAMGFSEADGGSGSGPVETMLVMEAIGRQLAVEPYLSTVILGGNLLSRGSTPAQRARLIPGIADGSITLAFAHGERQARYDLQDVATEARRRDGGFVLNGRKTAVLYGDSADLLVVSARTSGARRDPAGITLFLVDANAPGVTIQGYATQDGQRAAETALGDVAIGEDAILGPPDAALPLITQVTDIAIAAVAAEAVGAMDAIQALTLDYLRTRKQFGTPIGSFQSLQHKAADMMMALEQARSMAMFAAMMIEADPAERRPALSAAKVQINRSARLVGQHAVQLHGGIGMTIEYKVGHLFKRLAIIETLFGDTDHHVRQLAG